MIDTNTAPLTSAVPDRFSAPRHRRTGLILTGFVGLFLLFDAVIHLLRLTVVTDSFAALGYPIGVARGIGLLELICVVLYLLPRTSVLGAVLLTGYLGGAVSAQVRIEAPVASTMLFPVYVGIALWAGLFLRNVRLRELFPYQTSNGR